MQKLIERNRLTTVDLFLLFTNFIIAYIFTYSSDYFDTVMVSNLVSLDQ